MLSTFNRVQPRGATETLPHAVPLGALIAGVYERGVDLVTYALQATGTEEPNVGKKRGKVYLQAIGALIDSLCLLKDGKAVYLCR